MKVENFDEFFYNYMKKRFKIKELVKTKLEATIVSMLKYPGRFNMLFKITFVK